MKETTRLLELIKYFTLIKRSIRFTANADATIREISNSKYTKKSGYFNIESIILDYGSDYFSSLQEKEQHIFFGKCPVNISGSYEIPKDASELITPAITHDYVQLGKSFKRYIFPSTTDSTYTQKYKSYNDWHDKTVVNLHQNYYRTRSFNILIEQNSVDSFNSFLNESYSQWKTRFDQAKEDAKSGNFYYFSLFDPRIYKYELTFTDRIRILEYMIYLMDWPLFGDRDDVDVSELFISLISNINSTDETMLFNYMFQINPLTGQINLDDYKIKLTGTLYDSLMITLMKHFYSTKTIKEFSDGFDENLFYPVGLLTQYITPDGGPSFPTHLNLDTNDSSGTGLFTVGIKYDIPDINQNNFKVKINSAIQYRYNTYLKQVEYKKNWLIENRNDLNLTDIIYISPYLSTEKFNGLNIPYGCVIPIPAFALKWFVDQNEYSESGNDYISALALAAAIVFPVFQIFEIVDGIYTLYDKIYRLYNIIGVGFTIIGNTLNANFQDQIKRYDESKSTPGHPYNKGSYFLGIYYLVSSMYGTAGLINAISSAENKIKALYEIGNLLGAYGAISDFKSYMSINFPEERLDAFNSIQKQMNHAKIEYDKYKYLIIVK